MRLHDLVNESILLEYDRNKTIANYGPKLIAAANKDNSFRAIHQLSYANVDDRYLPDLMSRIEQADPTKNKEYVQGLANLYSKGGVKIEDLGSTVSDYITKFHKLKLKKQIPSPRNDFMRYSSIGDFMSVVDEYPDPEDETPKAKGTTDAYYEDGDLRVLVPKDRESACYYGKGTKWCTAATQNNMYDYYAKKDQLYIILLKKPAHTGEKYQFHFATKQFMDEQDRRIDLYALADRYPQLRNIFKKQAEQYNILELLSTKEEFNTKIKPALVNSIEDMVSYIKTNAEEVIKEIRTQLVRGAGRAEMYVIRDSMDELGISLYRHPEDLANLVAKLVIANPDVIGNEDELQDRLSDYLMDWFQEEDFYAVLEEYYNDEEDGDPDAWMDVAMTVSGEFGVFCSKMISAVVAEKIKQVLQK